MLSPILAELGGCVMRATQTWKHEKRPSASYMDVMKHLDDVTFDTLYSTGSRRVRNWVFEYSYQLKDIQTFFDDLQQSLKQHTCHLAVGFTGMCNEDGTAVVLVYMRKDDTKTINTDDLGVRYGKCVGAYKLSDSGRDKQVLKYLLTSLYNAYSEHISNVCVDRSCGVGYTTFEELVTACKKLTKQQLDTLKGRCELTNPKNRTEFQSAFLRSYNSIRNVKESQMTLSNGDVLTPDNLPFKVPELSDLRNLRKNMGSRLIQTDSGSDDKFEVYSLYDLIADPNLMTNYGIVMLGSNYTTGYGKSMFAIRLALEYVKAYADKECVSYNECRVIVVGTFDALTRYKPLRVKRDVVIFDEVNPGDKSQIVHSGPQTLKNVLNVASNSTVRGRGSDADIIFPAGMPVIFTANADNPSEWAGGALWTKPMQRKSTM